MTGTMVQQAAPSGKLLHTIELARRGECFQAVCSTLGVDMCSRDAAHLARRIRAAATVTLRRGELLEVVEASETKPVIDLLNVLPDTDRPECCVFWCATTRQFFRAGRVEAIGGWLWSWCPLCDTQRRVIGQHNFDANEPQCHPATIGGAQ